MVDKIGGIGLPEGSTGLSGLSGAAAAIRSPRGAESAAFDQILQQTLSAAGASVTPTEATAGSDSARVRFSTHAQQRMAQASVELGPQALAKLEAAVDKAGKKGGKESLILLDDLAFVVSVRNRTVITAVGADRLADNVFTNIDSVVIARHQEPDPQGELLSPSE